MMLYRAPSGKFHIVRMTSSGAVVTLCGRRVLHGATIPWDDANQFPGTSCKTCRSLNDHRYTVGKKVSR